MKFQPLDLRKKLLICFAIMVCAALFMSFIILGIHEIISDSFYRQISENLTSKLSQDESHHVDISQMISSLKLRHYQIAMLITCVFLCVWIIFFIFILRLSEPLNEIIKITRRMADGHLNETLDTRSGGEIGKIGENINELGVNVQEILLHVWKHTTDSMELLAHIQNKMPNQDDKNVSFQIQADIERINQSMEEIRGLIQEFELYDIYLEQEKVMAGEKTFRSNKEQP